jgi:hypothetical protein
MRSNRFDKISRLREQLPAEVYFGLLHAVATTGRMPILDPVTLRQTGEDHEVDDIKFRIETAKYLMDKVMPALKVIDEQDTEAIMAEKMAKIAADDAALRRMPAADIIHMLEAQEATRVDPKPPTG